MLCNVQYVAGKKHFGKKFWKNMGWRSVTYMSRQRVKLMHVPRRLALLRISRQQSCDSPSLVLNTCFLADACLLSGTFLCCKCLYLAVYWHLHCIYFIYLYILYIIYSIFHLYTILQHLRTHLYTITGMPTIIIDTYCVNISTCIFCPELNKLYMVLKLIFSTFR